MAAERGNIISDVQWNSPGVCLIVGVIIHLRRTCVQNALKSVLVSLSNPGFSCLFDTIADTLQTGHDGLNVPDKGFVGVFGVFGVCRVWNTSGFEREEVGVWFGNWVLCRIVRTSSCVG